MLRIDLQETKHTKYENYQRDLSSAFWSGVSALERCHHGRKTSSDSCSLCVCHLECAPVDRYDELDPLTQEVYKAIVLVTGCLHSLR